MSAYPLPRKYYLLVHDALRKVVGKDAELAAFVKEKKPFQCDMLVNALACDPEQSTNNPNYVKDFAIQLQGYLGICDVYARTRRIDIVFRDREVLQLALGAPPKSIHNLRRPEEINAERDWRRRNRLRISLGYDEELFTGSCCFSINLAARAMEKWVYDYYHRSLAVDAIPELQDTYVREGCDWRAVSPPVTYWQAHAYDLSLAYPCRHYQELLGTVAHNFAAYYGDFPFSNPYCPGEDLNTVDAVKWLCFAWKQLPLEPPTSIMETAEEGCQVKEGTDRT